MARLDENPYSSPNTPHPREPIKWFLQPLIIPKRIVGVAFMIAVAGPFIAWPIFLMGPAILVWFVPVGTSQETCERIYSITVLLAVSLVIGGPIAAAVCVVSGTWSQRAIVLLLAILYAPLLQMIIPRLWNALSLSP